MNHIELFSIVLKFDWSNVKLLVDDSFEIVSCLSTSGSHTVSLLNLYLINCNFLVMVSNLGCREGTSIMAFLFEACPMVLGPYIFNSHNITLTFKDWVWEMNWGKSKKCTLNPLIRFRSQHTCSLFATRVRFDRIFVLYKDSRGFAYGIWGL